MSLSAEQRAKLLDIVTRIEDGGLAPPRVRGPVGRFLHEFALLRTRVPQLVASEDNFVRGAAVGEILVTPLAQLDERIKSGMLGEVASTIAFSEELAGPVNVTLWGSARPANRLRNIWFTSPTTVRLVGNYRWFAPRRLTPGTALVTEADASFNRWNARCLKFMADEFLSDPPAVAYRWDIAFGPGDFRVFRVVVLYRSAHGWAVVPSTEDRLSRTVSVSVSARLPAGDLDEARLLLGLVARDPWDSRWSLVEATAVGPDQALGHMISWADLTRELLGQGSPAPAEILAFERTLSAIGHTATRAHGLAEANLSRAIPAAVKPLAAWSRGLA